MAWYLGVDAGGSFTRAAVWNAETGEGGEGHAGPGNPFSAGADLAFQAIEQAVAGALGQVGLHPGELRAACLGIAGLARLDPPADWLEAFLDWRIDDFSIVSDLEIAHYAAFQGEPGIQVISGTGSSVLVRDEAGQVHVYGGWGWLLGDEGSAVDLGRLAVRHTTERADAGAPPDALSAAVLRQWRLDRVVDLVPRLYHDARPRERLAELAPVVTRLAGEGDRPARHLVEAAAARLAEVVTAASLRLSSSGPLPLALAGSVFRADVFREAFLAAGAGSSRPWEPQRSPFSPLAGAVLRAAGGRGADAGDFLAQV